MVWLTVNTTKVETKDRQAEVLTKIEKIGSREFLDWFNLHYHDNIYFQKYVDIIALIYFAKQSNWALVKSLYDEWEGCFDINFQSHEGETLFDIGVKNAAWDLVNTLLDHAAIDLDLKGCNGVGIKILQNHLSPAAVSSKEKLLEKSFLIVIHPNSFEDRTYSAEELLVIKKFIVRSIFSEKQFALLVRWILIHDQVDLLDALVHSHPSTSWDKAIVIDLIHFCDPPLETPLEWVCNQDMFIMATILILAGSEISCIHLRSACQRNDIRLTELILTYAANEKLFKYEPAIGFLIHAIINKFYKLARCFIDFVDLDSTDTWRFENAISMLDLQFQNNIPTDADALVVRKALNFKLLASCLLRASLCNALAYLNSINLSEFERQEYQYYFQENHRACASNPVVDKLRPYWVIEQQINVLPKYWLSNQKIDEQAIFDNIFILYCNHLAHYFDIVTNNHLIEKIAYSLFSEDLETQSVFANFKHTFFKIKNRKAIHQVVIPKINEILSLFFSIIQELSQVICEKNLISNVILGYLVDASSELNEALLLVGKAYLESEGNELRHERRVFHECIPKCTPEKSR